jgi:hypothetical protein
MFKDKSIMKKQYIKPTMNVVELQHQCQMLAGSVQNLNTNLGADGLILGEASDEDAR